MRAYQSDKTTQLHSALVRSPMPGKITRIMVSQGELIEAGQGVVILEAMKMENEIKAPSAGIVKAIRIQEADAVEKNAILIEIS
jgi:pyruvate carboxylase subunit B